jgi:hypothetical protein
VCHGSKLQSSLDELLNLVVVLSFSDGDAHENSSYSIAPNESLTHAPCPSSTSQGNRSENLRTSMECHARSEEVRDWEEQPSDQCSAKEIADLMAILEFHGVEEFVCREAEPQAWAESRIEAADKYLNLVDAAERKANMEKVIAHYLAAAEVLTKEEFPKRWAHIQMSLCDAYLQRVEGVRRENMENAMKCFNACEEVRGDDPLPADWLKQQWEKGAEARRRDAAMTG